MDGQTTVLQPGFRDLILRSVPLRSHRRLLAHASEAQHVRGYAKGKTAVKLSLFTEVRGKKSNSPKFDVASSLVRRVKTEHTDNAMPPNWMQTGVCRYKSIDSA